MEIPKDGEKLAGGRVESIIQILREMSFDLNNIADEEIIFAERVCTVVSAYLMEVETNKVQNWFFYNIHQKFLVVIEKKNLYPSA